MTFGATEGKPWVEALSTERGSTFAGRTFSRFHIVSNGRTAPSISEIWATHAVESHAHDSDELFHVLRGAIEVNGRRLGPNDVLFIPGGSRYSARVLTEEGSHLLRIELPSTGSRARGPEYDARPWRGPLTADGFPDLSESDGIAAR